MKLKEYLFGTREELNRLQEIEPVHFDDYHRFFNREGNLAWATLILASTFDDKPYAYYIVIPPVILAVDLVSRRFGIDLKKDLSLGLVGLVREPWHNTLKRMSGLNKNLFYYNTNLIY